MKSSSLANFYGGSIAKVLTDLYPNIHDTEFHITRMAYSYPSLVNNTNKGHNYWQSPCNCKFFFDSLAEKLGFKPSQTEKWYTVTKEQVTRQKVCLPVTELVSYLFQ